jgi:hypothetical protein
MFGGAFADHPDHAAALDDLAVLTDWLDAASYLQDRPLKTVQDKTLIIDGS